MGQYWNDTYEKEEKLKSIFNYMVDERLSLRHLCKETLIPKSTLFDWYKYYLKDVDYDLYKRVEWRLKINAKHMKDKIG